MGPPNKPGFKPVPCQLEKGGQDLFAVMTRVNDALRKHGHADLIAEFQKRVLSGESLKKTCLDYVYEEEKDDG